MELRLRQLLDDNRRFHLALVAIRDGPVAALAFNFEYGSGPTTECDPVTIAKTALAPFPTDYALHNTMLRWLLLHYGRHEGECPAHGECDCAWDAIRTNLLSNTVWAEGGPTNMHPMP